jgi:cholesterol oxidase
MSVDVAEAVDAVVVGSGFGGAVAAHRLADAGRSVVVLERGRAYPPGSFARSPTEFAENFWSPDDHLYGLYQAWSFSGLEGLVSAGLGGGSLIYANVLLRKDPEWFVRDSPIPGGGYETWPIGREQLDPHYDRVEEMLGARSYPYPDTPKTIAFEAAATRAGYATIRPPLAVSFAPGRNDPPSLDVVLTPDYGNIHHAPRFTCRLCGECDIGCNYGAKNTLDHTYLSAAAHAGADVRTLHEVKGFHRDADGWVVRLAVHDLDGGPSVTRAIRARVLVLAAGTFGSTFLLLKNRAALPGLSDAIGTRFSGNGDLLGFLFNAREGIEREARARTVAGSRGPVITSAIRVGDVVDGTGARGRGYYVEDAGYPGFLNWLIEAAQLRSVVSRSTRIAARLLLSRIGHWKNSDVSRDLADAVGRVSISSSSMPLLGMGRDVPDGRMYLDRGRLAVDWTTATSLAFFDDIRGTMADVAKELGADYQDDPLWWARRVITVHPLGGAPMGRNSHEGVVDEWGRVFGTEGLCVVDGAAMPGPVGANPALTIAAFADRAMEHELEAPRSRAHRPRRSPRPEGVAVNQPTPVPGATAVSFTEQMKGFVGLGTADPAEAYEDARLRREDLMFELTITADDVAAFVADPAHQGGATGYVEGEVIGGRCVVEQGWFNLFVAAGQGTDRRMLYRLWFTPDSGEPLTLVGFKDIHDDPGFDLWEDTTTLFVQLLDGHVPPGDVTVETGLLPVADARVRGAGILRIAPLDFAKQLTTFAAEGPQGAEAIAEFGELFLGQLWHTYAGLATGRGGR